MLLLFGFVDDLVIIKYSNEKCHELILQKLAFEKKNYARNGFVTIQLFKRNLHYDVQKLCRTFCMVW